MTDKGNNKVTIVANLVIKILGYSFVSKLTPETQIVGGVYDCINVMMITFKRVLSVASFPEGRYKTWNRTEWNRTGSNCCTIRTWTPDMQWKIGVNMPGYQCTES